MNKGTLIVLGHQIEYENHTGDTIDMVQLEEQVESGDKQGTLYWHGYTIPIGNWKIVNPDADKWRSIAEKLYKSLKGVGRWYAGDSAEAVLKEYEGIKSEQ